MKINKYQILFSFLAVLALVFTAFAQVAPNPPAGGSAAPAIYLFWSADTYVPNDYPGKSLPVYDSWVTVTAVVSGKGINPDDLFYHWWVDDFYQTQDVGAGRKSYKRHIGVVPSGTAYSVKVLAVSRDNKIRLEKIIDVATAFPEIAVYRYDESKKSRAFEANKEESVKFGEQVGFIAEPFFFSIQKLEDLVFKWLPGGGSEIEGKKPDPNVLSLKIPSGADLASLISRLDLSVENPFSSIQKESATVRLNVGQ